MPSKFNCRLKLLPPAILKNIAFIPGQDDPGRCIIDGLILFF